jgi:hypothetical protein
MTTNRDLDRLCALAAQGLSMRREGDGTVDRIRALLGEARRHRVHDLPRPPQAEAGRPRARGTNALLIPLAPCARDRQAHLAGGAR